MRGHIKLFTLQMDMKRAEQLRAAASNGSVRRRESCPSIEPMLSHAPQG